MRERDEPSWGLAAIGSSGAMTVELDEAVSGPDRWRLSITGDTWSLAFEVPGPRTVRACLEFVNAHHGSIAFASLALGTFQRAPAVLRKDDEYPDRFFLVVEGEHFLFLTLAGEQLAHLRAALEQAAMDLREAF